MALTESSTDALESLLDGDLHCGYEFHDAGVYGHVPGQLATWEVRLPCGHRGHTCDGWKNLITSSAGIECGACGRLHLLATIEWMPI